LDRRGHRGRDPVRPAPARHVRDRRHHRPRLPAGAGLRPRPRAPLRPDQPAGGLYLHVPRPPDPLPLRRGGPTAGGDGRPPIVGPTISGGSAGEAELPAVGALAWPALRARSESPLAQGLRRLRKNRIALVGAAIVALLLLVAAFADVLAPKSPTLADQTRT